MPDVRRPDLTLCFATASVSAYCSEDPILWEQAACNIRSSLNLNLFWPGTTGLYVTGQWVSPTGMVGSPYFSYTAAWEWLRPDIPARIPCKYVLTGKLYQLSSTNIRTITNVTQVDYDADAYRYMCLAHPDGSIYNKFWIRYP